MEKPEMFICDCNSIDHQVIFFYDKDDDETYIQIHLTTRNNFFKRLWIGLTYAFGFKSRFGDWDCFILNPSDKKRLLEYLTKNTPNS